MKKYLLLALLFIMVKGAMAQCPGITFTSSVNVATATFTPVVPANYAISGYTWYFGDGGNSTLTSPTHTYAANGLYSVCLIVYGVNNATNTSFQCSVCDSVLISGQVTPCNSNYTFTQTGLTVNFTGTGNGPGAITNWAWNFGDGNQSNLQNPTHTYTAAGTYYPCLSVYGYVNNVPFTCNFCDTVVVTNPVTPCNASFTNSLGTGNVVSFTNTSTAPGTIAGYSWTFGDGGNAAVSNPTHTYATGGWYNVCLTIWGQGPNGGFQCVYCDSVYAGNIISPCNSNYTFTQTGLTVNFTGTGSGPGPISNWAWNFGDGNQSSVQNPSHTYATAGTYYPCLTIYGIFNNTPYTCTYCDTVVVSNGVIPCNAAFTYTYGPNGAVTFINTSTGSGTLTASTWTFGDGGTATATNPTHSYTNNGWFNVCLSVTYNVNGQLTTCTFCDSVPVQTATANCAMTANFTNTISGPYVVFTNTSTCVGCSNIAYTWTFGDGNTVGLSNPTHAYSLPGTYTVCLIAQGYNANQQPCIDTFCTSITVNPSGLNNYSVNNTTLLLTPNPAQSTVMFNVPNAESYWLECLSVTGALQMEQRIAGRGEHTLPISSLAPGLYFIRLRSNNQTYHGRFIKQ